MQSYKNGSNTDNIVPHHTLGGNRIGQSQYCRPFYKVMLDKPRKVGGIINTTYAHQVANGLAGRIKHSEGSNKISLLPLL